MDLELTDLAKRDGRTDGQTDGWTNGRTDKLAYRDVWTHLKRDQPANILMNR